MLGSELIGAEVTSIAPNVWAVNMDPELALAEYGMMALHSKTLFKLLFDNKYVRTFFRAVPGMQEWTLLGKAWWHTTETREDGSWLYDVVILDAPATGHGLDMLRVPKIILDVVPPGLLRRDAERAWKMFQDPETCAVVLVTLPEEMPTTETIELAKALRDELQLPIGQDRRERRAAAALLEGAERAAIEAVGARQRRLRRRRGARCRTQPRHARARAGREPPSPRRGAADLAVVPSRSSSRTRRSRRPSRELAKRMV